LLVLRRLALVGPTASRAENGALPLLFHKNSVLKGAAFNGYFSQHDDLQHYAVNRWAGTHTPKFPTNLPKIFSMGFEIGKGPQGDRIRIPAVWFPSLI
jgi:hypothetical protein